MKKETFIVNGMSCSACSAAVERSVIKLNGIVHAEVNLLTNSMNAEYDEKIISASDIISAVESAGYKASLKDNVPKNIQNKLEKNKNRIKLRLILSSFFLLLLMLISMGHMVDINIIPHNKHILKGIVEITLLVPILLLNFRYFSVGFNSLIKLRPNMDSLIATGAAASVIFSIWQMIKGGADHYYFESAGMILTFITIGKYLESKSKSRTTDAVTKLMDLSPKTSIVLRNGIEVEVDSKDIMKGDTVIVKSGMVFPADGTVTEGTGYADESAITGESVPVKKNTSSVVIGGTILSNGYIKFIAEKVGEETTLSGIIRLVEEATLTKPKIQKFADKISRIFVPCVITLAASVFTIWYLISKDFELSLNFSISVLVISCPCALGLATPTAIMVGTGKAAELGILVKNAEVFEAGSRITTVMLDKTGTITEGKPVVTDIISDPPDIDEVIDICVNIESMSDHPLAQAIASYKTADKNYIIKNFKSIDGKGVKAECNTNKYKIGSKKFVTNNIIPTIFTKAEEDLALKGKTAVYVSKNEEVVTLLGISDTIKETSNEALRML